MVAQDTSLGPEIGRMELESLPVSSFALSPPSNPPLPTFPDPLNLSIAYSYQIPPQSLVTIISFPARSLIFTESQTRTDRSGFSSVIELGSIR